MPLRSPDLTLYPCSCNCLRSSPLMYDVSFILNKAWDMAMFCSDVGDFPVTCSAKVYAAAFWILFSSWCSWLP